WDSPLAKAELIEDDGCGSAIAYLRRSQGEQTLLGQGDGGKNTHPATSKPVARATRGTSKCPQGGKIFRGRNSMRRHQRNPPGERPHTCPDGGKTCKDFSSLISQRRAQKGERPYKCLECGESFPLPEQLPPRHARLSPRTGELPPVPVLRAVPQRGHRVSCPSEAPLEEVPVGQGASLGVLGHQIRGLRPPWVGTSSPLVSSHEPGDAGGELQRCLGVLMPQQGVFGG
ncbi:zinc finger protein 7-like, partial [Athene cunicularia]|uniref:zinc finger protein 7-like n=1 Tax=Athene cunicularia TaxID=194338 RepID=UPI000EF6E0F4